jgi:hypothetical protein
MIIRKRKAGRTLNYHLNAQWGAVRRISPHDMPIFVNYELCEVPFDARSKDTTFLRPQEFIQRRSIAAVHVDLFGNSGHHLQIEASMVYCYIVTLRQRAEMLFAGYTLPKK